MAALTRSSGQNDRKLIYYQSGRVCLKVSIDDGQYREDKHGPDPIDSIRHESIPRSNVPLKPHIVTHKFHSTREGFLVTGWRLVPNDIDLILYKDQLRTSGT
ncbi:hypothetical protein TNIN_488281 [Trichonephila inaurata madagascariensis]|uniref:Uncharacterized protein n=1 Tax=Trichonephila inaurata madagascariensis TaxID=2747483 RepID=A0A8X6XEL8_9ARAC|nr:hypothetical protein TNIN_488281 [Trichonephila inaurata madagascariensis]